jgi:hypothetical protein
MRKQRRGSAKGPSTSNTNQPGFTPKYLPCREWTFTQLKALVQSNLGIDCDNCVGFGFNTTPGVFVMVNDQNGSHTTEVYPLEFVGDRLYLDGNTLGDVLANLQHGGIDALELYISARQRTGIHFPFSKIKSAYLTRKPSSDMS